jgi:hypothetical protein
MCVWVSGEENEERRFIVVCFAAYMRNFRFYSFAGVWI